MHRYACSPLSCRTRDDLEAQRVCRAWRTLIWDDQLLWRALYERQGWAYDQAAVEWWNAQAVYAPLSPRVSRSSIPCAVSPDEGMALNEEETALGLLSPPKRREDASDVAKSDGRASPIGLPPSPRHRGFPALRSSPSPTPTGYNDDMLDVVPSRIPLPASPRRINGLPLRRPLRRSSTMTSTKSTTSSPKKRSSPPSPAGFDASRVSRIHYDREGRPWICWRHLFMARTLLDRNWRHGIFEMHELQKPMLRFPSSAPAPPSTHPPNTPYADGVYAIQFDGDRLVAGLRGGMAIRFDLRTGKPMRTYRFHTQSVLCLQYDTPETRLEGEGERLVTGSSDGYAVIWDLESGKVLHALHVSRASSSSDVETDTIDRVIHNRSSAFASAATHWRLARRARQSLAPSFCGTHDLYRPQHRTLAHVRWPLHAHALRSPKCRVRCRSFASRRRRLLTLAQQRPLLSEWRHRLRLRRPRSPHLVGDDRRMPSYPLRSSRRYRRSRFRWSLHRNGKQRLDHPLDRRRLGRLSCRDWNARSSGRSL